MVKRLPAPSGGSFPWGLLAQAVLLVIAVIAEVVEKSKKK